MSFSLENHHHEDHRHDGENRLVFFGGKGGVGKTTLAAAFASLLAEKGQKTLLVSTDPAHSTSDILGKKLSGEPTEIGSNLFAVEIDAAADASEYIEKIKRESKDSVSPEVLPTVEKHLEMSKSNPGTEESALFDRFVDLIALCPGTYDRVVFDTAPTGHTLRLLTLPALLSAWVEGMVRQREKVAGMERSWFRLVTSLASCSMRVVRWFVKRFSISSRYSLCCSSRARMKSPSGMFGSTRFTRSAPIWTPPSVRVLRARSVSSIGNLSGMRTR